MATAPTFHRPARTRAACAAGAIVVTGVLGASLLGLFHRVSPPHWLTPTPEQIALAADCQALPGRAERQRCTQAVIAAHRDRAARDDNTVVAHGR